jgi:hypothetical protein
VTEEVVLSLRRTTSNHEGAEVRMWRRQFAVRRPVGHLPAMAPFWQGLRQTASCQAISRMGRTLRPTQGLQILHTVSHQALAVDADGMQDALEHQVPDGLPRHRQHVGGLVLRQEDLVGQEGCPVDGSYYAPNQKRIHKECG